MLIQKLLILFALFFFFLEMRCKNEYTEMVFLYVRVYYFFYNVPEDLSLVLVWRILSHTCHCSDRYMR